jgi:hypothetical protein
VTRQQLAETCCRLELVIVINLLCDLSLSSETAAHQVVFGWRLEGLP